jgi:ferredoxin-NADP reductase
VTGATPARVPPAARLSPTMAALDAVVQAVFVPLATSTRQTRRPAGHVDRDLRAMVTAVEQAADGVVAVTFRHERGERLPAWSPGAHVDVLLPSGRMRQYSLTGPDDDPHHYRIAVRAIAPEQGGGGGSLEVHGLRIGERVTLRGPRHAFPFVAAEHGYLFVAGGIGITPILPMLRHTARLDRVPWALVYTGRTRASMPFLDEIGALAAGRPERVHLWPDDEHGRPDPEQILALAPPGALLYACGPASMIEALRTALPAGRVAALHSERFSPAPVRGGRPFPIRLARSGVTVTVGAEESALAAVRRARPAQAYSCRQGFCGTCRVRVLSGAVDHRDHVLTPSEREGHLMLCVSRAVDGGELVLDL